MRPAHLAACALAFTLPALTPAKAEIDRSAIVANYADIAAAGYADSLTGAKALSAAVDAFLAAPSEDTLAAARTAWRAARTPYMQTEVFRFGNPIVDDWEGRVNAWPLDEGLIDYVAPGYFGAEENTVAELNVVATPKFTLSGQQVDASRITPALLSDVLQEADGNEANVATGYHAIEFLLWGQDLTSDKPVAGQRPYTDYLQGDGCTHGNCDRRAAYLKTATDLLVSDLSWMTAQWTQDGPARTRLMADPDAGIAAILTGMGSLSYGELAGQRVKLGLMLHDPEEEHDCFSDNTPESHHDDVLGVQNVYLGRYTRTDGSVVSGPSLSALVAAADPDLDAALKGQLTASLAATQALRDASARGMHYDMMLQVGNDAGGKLIMALVDTLVAQSRSIERVSTALHLSGVNVAGDDSLNAPGEVFK
ncbi:imelysin family protein [Acidimangrovimonas pyrenivorans]|uniref:Imelysin family protein n=1 Tax=Acidimangrovimonas pyrenivorans TaxID=2030798 RepID=A0ABV7AJZ3_9RHOB